jgi:amino-acid N-acetyltransferase
MAYEIQKARMEHVPEIFHLISMYAERGLMLSKSYSFIYEHLRQYTVAIDGNRVAAAGALRLFWYDLGEICSLAVGREYTGKGIGKAIVSALEKEAVSLGLSRFFALTYEVEFFKRCGFTVTSLSVLPEKIWKDCIHCPKRKNCDETAMEKIFPHPD